MRHSITVLFIFIAATSLWACLEPEERDVPTDEVCNGLDDDGDGAVDEDLMCLDADQDGDGFIEPDDCDDLDPSVNPEAAESCDGRDDDCDGEVDEGCTACVSDADCDDGEFCDGGESCVDGACIAIPGIPCDDGDPATMDVCDEETDTCSYSVVCSEEICENGLDDDCDGLVDEGCTACVSDADCDDGEFCDGGESCVDGACIAIPGIPCDDGDPATMDICDEEADTCSYSVVCSEEICGNGLDDDCDGLVDEECDSGSDDECDVDDECPEGMLCVAGACAEMAGS
jgi:hypothetical protein